MPDQDILRMGKLYMEDLEILRGESSGAALTYAVLTSLSETSYARNHNGELILTTSKLSDFMHGRLSSRMIRRQLNGLKTSMQGRYTEIRKSGFSRIRLTRKSSRGRFIQVFSPSCKTAEYTASEIILFSLLLDRAAFNYRCGGDFCVLPSQIPGVISASGLCRRTALNALAAFAVKGHISSPDGRDLKAGTAYFHGGFTFSRGIFISYQEQVRLKRSEKCLKIAEKRAYGLCPASAGRPLSVKAPGRRGPMAQVPNPVAQKPCPVAQSCSLKAGKSDSVFSLYGKNHNVSQGIISHQYPPCGSGLTQIPDSGKRHYAGGSIPTGGGFL